MKTEQLVKTQKEVTTVFVMLDGRAKRAMVKFSLFCCKICPTILATVFEMLTKLNFLVQNCCFAMKMM